MQFYTGKSRSGEDIKIAKAIHDDPMGTIKNSAQKTFEWRKNISSSLIQTVEEHCEKPMKELGYAKWIPNNDVTLIKSAFEVWPFS